MWNTGVMHMNSEIKELPPGPAGARDPVMGGGLSSGNGLMNGNGLINGDGIVNGNDLLELSHPRERKLKNAREGDLRLLGAIGYYGRRTTTAWVLLVVLILMGVGYLALPGDQESGIEVDGDFSDWDDVRMVADTELTENPSLDLLRYRVLPDSTHLSLYMETRATLLPGLGNHGDTIQVFFDTDLDRTTGYALPLLGADHLLEVYGRENQVLSSHLYRFDRNYRTEEERANNDWSGWSPLFPVEVGVSDNELELRLWQAELQLEGSDVRIRIRLQDSSGNTAESHIFNTGRSLVQVEVEGGVLAPLKQDVENHVLSLEVLPQGENIVLERLVFREDSTATDKDLEGFSLYLGGKRITVARMKGGLIAFENLSLSLTEETRLSLGATLSPSAVPGHVLSLTLEDVDCRKTAVSLETGVVRGYLVSSLYEFVVDGLFDEWRNPEQEDNDRAIPDPDINITHHDHARKDEATYFFLSVAGNVLAGVSVPSTRAMQSNEGTGAGSWARPSEPQTTTQEKNPLPVRTGEDTIYILLNTGAGQGYQSPDIGFQVDAMIEITGQHGDIRSASYLEFAGSDPQEWKWRFVRDVQAAAGQHELETVAWVDLQNICFHVVSWSGDEDRAGFSGVNLTRLKGTRGAADVVINELYYGGDSSSYEWVELFNSGTSDVTIDGWTLDDGEGTWTIPDPQGDEYTLSTGEYVVLARDGATFYDNYGSYPDFEKGGDTQAVDLQTSGSLLLANSEEQLILNSTTSVIDFVAYDVSSSHGSGWGVTRWAIANDHWGQSGGKDFVDTTSSWDSIARDSSSTDSDTPSDWSRFGDNDEPTPGARNIEEFRNVLVPVGVVGAVWMVLRKKRRQGSSRIP